jgi:hypothetical protein
MSSGLAFARYGTPETLKAAMNQGSDLSFAKQAAELGASANLSNAVFARPRQGDGKLRIRYQCDKAVADDSMQRAFDFLSKCGSK